MFSAAVSFLSLLLLLLLPTTGLAFPADQSTDYGSRRCNPKALVRKEWSRLTPLERISFTDAVKCLLRQPSKIPAGLAPGAKARYHDYIGTHINLTYFVHNDGQFLPWHRHFLWLMEKELRTTCGYTAALPYWDWPLWADNLDASPLFDGSATSLGGNGVYDPTSQRVVSANFTFPHGTGGGCVKCGPFANLFVPFQTFPQGSLFSFRGQLPADALAYKPHCLSRDLNSYIARHNTNASIVDYLINKAPSIADFQDTLDRVVLGSPYYGPHAGGHLAVGLVLGDVFASPSDPAFFLHHGFIDLMWAKWQAKNPKDRVFALSGGSTFLNIPPSPDVTVDFELDYGYLADKVKIGDVMDITNGPYCYSYEY